ncbi:MAG TPA: proline dehydrogenase family protein, partial [Vicinamibacterales bacterium]|nr:proline dehydrogenase family protein [Vicinamibacterales bacterium]
APVAVRREGPGLMVDAVSRAAFTALGSSALLKRVASRYGMRQPGSFARRFVAGESVSEAIAAARALESEGYVVTLDLLGESVASTEAAAAATAAYVAIMADIARAGITRNLSVKLTQLGLDVDTATAIDNLRRVLDAAGAAEFVVRIDMEGSAYATATLQAFETVWGIGYRNVGVVIQSYLKRSADDVDRMNALGASVRLVKGAYREPATVAFQRKADVDRAFVSLMETLIAAGVTPAIATHDPAMIDATRAFASGLGVPIDAFEFQMLYGVRRDLQRALVADGYRVRIYVPFGTEWFPYFMRRLGERPANVSFVLRSVWKDRGEGQ